MMNTKKKYNKRRENNASPIRNVEANGSVDQDEMIKLGLHPRRIISREEPKRPYSEKSKVKMLKSQHKQLAKYNNKVESEPRGRVFKDFTVKCIVNVANTIVNGQSWTNISTGKSYTSNTFPTTHSRYCKLSEIGEFLSDLRGLKLKPIKMYINGEEHGL